MTSNVRLRLSHHLAARRVCAAAGRAADGLGTADVLTLAALYERDGTSTAVLAERLLVPKPHAQAVVQRLVGAGYVEKEADEVWLTMAGRQLRRVLDQAVRRIAGAGSPRPSARSIHLN